MVVILNVYCKRHDSTGPLEFGVADDYGGEIVYISDVELVRNNAQWEEYMWSCRMLMEYAVL